MRLAAGRKNKTLGTACRRNQSPSQTAGVWWGEIPRKQTGRQEALGDG